MKFHFFNYGTELLRRFTPGNNKLLFLLPIIFISIFFTPTLMANTSTKLNAITHNIETIRHSLTLDQHHKQQYQVELARLETQAAQLYKTLNQTQEKYKREKQQYEQLNQSEQNYEIKLNVEQALLAKQMRDAYTLNQQPSLKLLLNQDSASKTKRLLTYYTYLSQDELDTIHSIKNIIRHIKQNQKQITDQAKQLKTLESVQSHQQQHLNETKQNRLVLIQTINKQITSKSDRLAKLQADKNLLEKTISRLQKSFLIHSIDKQNLSQHEGQLSWPTKGELINHFGSSIEQSELTWTGVLISAPIDQPVYSIANGQVVFAKWMPGYGLLMIINHGHGFMSLYGRNQHLYKKVGDIVTKGELISSVGETGGYQFPSLYFALRQNAQPLNPEKWCH